MPALGHDLPASASCRRPEGAPEDRCLQGHKARQRLRIGEQAEQAPPPAWPAASTSAASRLRRRECIRRQDRERDKESRANCPAPGHAGHGSENRPAPGQIKHGEQEAIAVARARPPRRPSTARMKMNGVARPSCGAQEFDQKAHGEMTVRRRGRTGRRRSPSDAATATKDWAGRSASASSAAGPGPGRPQPGARARRLANSQSKAPAPRNSAEYLDNSAKPAATPAHSHQRPSPRALHLGETKQKRGAGDDGRHVRRRRQHLHADHQGEIEQQRRQRGAPSSFRDRTRRARQTNQLASTDRSTPLARTPKARVAEQQCAGADQPSDRGRMIEIAGVPDAWTKASNRLRRRRAAAAPPSRARTRRSADRDQEHAGIARHDVTAPARRTGWTWRNSTRRP